ncbi:MAG: hypothetical protein ACQ9MH_24785 [Nitrospinales bacterium]
MTESEKKILHILLSKPDEKQKKLMNSVTLGKSVQFYALFAKEETEYDQLIDLIFEYDQIITWW